MPETPVIPAEVLALNLSPTELESFLANGYDKIMFPHLAENN